MEWSDFYFLLRIFYLRVSSLRKLTMSAIKITSPADYSMASSLANANAMLSEIMPEIIKLKEALTGNVLNAEVLLRNGFAEPWMQYRVKAGH